MKKVILILTMVLTVIGTGLAAKTPDLTSEIKNKVSVSLDGVNTAELKKEFVEVQFRIEEGELIVMDIRGTQEVLSEKIREELKGLKVTGKYSEDCVYSIRFRFKEV